MGKITKKMIRDGIENGNIRFTVDPITGTGTVCYMGDRWLSFGEWGFEEQSPEEYVKNTPIETMVSEIFDTLEEFREDEIFADSYAYYEAFLRSRQKFQRAYEKYKLQWMLDHGYTLRDLINELEQTRVDIDCNDDLYTIFDIWEKDTGFGSEIWPCAEEYYDREYQEHQPECITVKIPIGNLVAEPSTDPAYPGIWISLHNSAGEELSLVLVEYDSDKKTLITRVWGDADVEDHMAQITHENLENFVSEKEI